MTNFNVGTLVFPLRTYQRLPFQTYPCPPTRAKPSLQLNYLNKIVSRIPELVWLPYLFFFIISHEGFAPIFNGVYILYIYYIYNIYYIPYYRDPMYYFSSIINLKFISSQITLDIDRKGSTPCRSRQINWIDQGHCISFIS